MQIDPAAVLAPPHGVLQADPAEVFEPHVSPTTRGAACGDATGHTDGAIEPGKVADLLASLGF